MFDNERDQFGEWSDKLVNAVSRMHPTSGTFLKAFNKEWANESGAIAHEVKAQNPEQLKQIYKKWVET